MPRKLSLLTMPVVTLAFASAASALDFGPNNFSSASTVASPVNPGTSLRLIASLGGIQGSQGLQGSANANLKLSSGTTLPLLNARPITGAAQTPSMPSVPAVIPASVTVGITFAYDLPTIQGTWAGASALPDFLTLVPVTVNGVTTTQIRGTATVAGVTSVPLIFTSSTGAGTFVSTFQLTAVAVDNATGTPPPLLIGDTTNGGPISDPAALAQELGFSVTVNNPFSYRLPTVSPETPFSVVGSLPAGVTLEGNGIITGAFITTGVQTITVKLGATGASTTITLAANVTQAILNSSNVAFKLSEPNSEGTKPTKTYFVVEVGQPMDVRFPLATGGATGVTYSVDGAPSGVTMDSTGKLFGIPTVLGRYQMTIHLTKAGTEVVTTTSVVDVMPPPEDDRSRYVEVRDRLTGKGCGSGSVAMMGIGMLMLGLRRRR